jgi:hypothetical protein
MRKSNEAVSMRGSLNSTMGEPLVARNKQAYSGHRELPIALDAVASEAYAQRRLLSEFQLRGSIFYPCNPPARHHARHASKARRAGVFGEAKPVPKKHKVSTISTTLTS